MHRSVIEVLLAAFHPIEVRANGLYKVGAHDCNPHEIVGSTLQSVQVARGFADEPQGGCCSDTFDAFLCSLPTSGEPGRPGSLYPDHDTQAWKPPLDLSAAAPDFSGRTPDGKLNVSVLTLGKFISRWVLLLYLGSTATPPHRYVPAASLLRQSPWAPETCLDWAMRDVCTSVNGGGKGNWKQSKRSPKLPASWQLLVNAARGARFLGEDPDYYSRALRGAASAGGVWWAGQLLRRVLSSLSTCGIAAVGGGADVAARASSVLSPQVTPTSNASCAALPLPQHQLGVAAFTAAGSCKRIQCLRIAMHIRRGDACERWAAPHDFVIARDLGLGRPCYYTSAYVEAAHALCQQLHCAAAVLLVVSDSPDAFAEVRQSTVNAPWVADVVELRVSRGADLGLVEEGALAKQDKKGKKKEKEMPNLQFLQANFVESRNQRGLINRSAHFRGFMGELLASAAAEAFVGTSASITSRLHFLAVTAGRTSSVSPPSVAFIDRPLRGIWHLPSPLPGSWDVSSTPTETFPLESGAQCPTSCVCEGEKEEIVRGKIDCSCAWGSNQSDCYLALHTDIDAGASSACKADARCKQRFSHCHYITQGVIEGRRACIMPAPDEVADGTLLQSWLLKTRGPHIACVTDAWLQERSILTPQDLWLLDRRCTAERWDTQKTRDRLWATLEGKECSKRNLLRVDTHTAGWFATLHGIVKPLMHAVLTKRSLLPPRINGYVPRNCSEGTLSCLFKPLSRCAAHDHAESLTETAKAMVASTNNFLHTYSQEQLKESRLVPSEGWFWWSSVLFGYVMRPSMSLKREVERAFLATGLSAALRDRELVLGLHVRQGDSCTAQQQSVTKRECEPLDVYMETVRQLARGLNLRTIYISTDSRKVLSQTKNWPEFRFLHFEQAIKASTEDKGNADEVWEDTISRRDGMGQGQSNLLLAQKLTIDVILLSQCHLFVGKHTSNYFRAARELNAAQFGRVAPFHSRDSPWCFDWGVMAGTSFVTPAPDNRFMC